MWRAAQVIAWGGLQLGRSAGLFENVDTDYELNFFTNSTRDLYSNTIGALPYERQQDFGLVMDGLMFFGLTKSLLYGANGVVESNALKNIVGNEIGAIGDIKKLKNGACKVTDWATYPDGVTKPNTTIKLIEGEEYSTVRNNANKVNRKLHIENPELDGFDIHEIHPVKLGGNPTDISNKMAVTRTEHSQFSNFWKKVQKNIEKDIKK